MTQNFVTADRAQSFLLPPSLADWLPEDHLAWFVIGVVEPFDLAAFRVRYRGDGRGGAAYDPAVMVAVLLYAYSVGDRSSRLIERRLRTDVAYRVVAANLTPDHATVARFRAEHEDALNGLFTQVLGLAAAAGMVRVGVVAIDGTKLGADASGMARMSEERLRAEVRRWLDEARQVDEAEDVLYGDTRGDELPGELADPRTRAAAIRRAKEALEAQQREAAERGGQAPSEVNVTDPDSRVMKTVGGYVQGYNAQTIVDETQVMLAAELRQDHADVTCLAPLLAAAEANLDAAGVQDTIGVVLADAGYWSLANTELDTDRDLWIATGKPDRMAEHAAPLPAPDPEPVDDRHERRVDVMQRWAAGAINAKQAATELGLSIPQTYTWRDSYRRGGVEALRPKRRAPGSSTRRPPSAAAVARQAMAAKLATPAGKTLYARRGQLVEPVFGQLKHDRAARRFMRRGLSACASEWKLLATTHNLLKIWRNRITRPPTAIA